MYDAVFVGAGIVSLYAAHRYKQRWPDRRVVVLEKSARIGGRTRMASFEGLRVNAGAGVGRMRKDRELLRLVRELGVEVQIFREPIGYARRGDEGRVERDLSALGRARPLAGETFREFGARSLGQTEYERFVDAAGYGDFEGYDASVAMRHYGFDDTWGVEEIFYFSWEKVCERLAMGLDVRFGARVVSVRGSAVAGGRGCAVEAIVGGERVSYEAKREVFVGATASTLRRLFGAERYSRLGAQPFLRIYAKLNKRLPISAYTVVERPLQKVLPIRRNVYMIAYADNRSALALRRASTERLEEELRSAFGDAEIRVLKKRAFFWSEGTHYWKPGGRPTREVLNPAPGVHVIGEAVSWNQGWTGPAIRRVDRLLQEI